jgi:hypothetical protein
MNSRTAGRILFGVFLALAPAAGQAQKKVYQQLIDIPMSPFLKKMISSQIVTDSASGQKLLLISNRKGMNFTLLDAAWKKVKEFEGGFVKNSPMAKDGFKVLQAKKNGDNWTLVTSAGLDEFARETINPVAGTHTVDEKLFDDFDNSFIETTFRDGNDSYMFYIAKRNKESIMVTRFDNNMAVKSYPLSINTQLPLRKSSKYAARDIYTMIEEMNDAKIRSLAFTRKKVQLYVQPEIFLLGICEDEPVAELNWFDKSSGRKLKSELFSVESILPEGERKNSFNTSFLVHEGKVWVLAAHKNGGALGVFDIATKKVLYSLSFDDKTDPATFAYNPCMYESSPGTVTGLSANKERVKEMSMNSFCKELYKHSVGLALAKGEDGLYRVVLGNFDLKEIAAATSSLRSGMNTMVSPDYYMMASAGLIIDPTTMKPVARKSSYNEMYGDAVSGKYTKVKDNPARSAGGLAEVMADPHREVLGTSQAGNTFYSMYLTSDKMLKVFESKF